MHKGFLVVFNVGFVDVDNDFMEIMSLSMICYHLTYFYGQ